MEILGFCTFAVSAGNMDTIDLYIPFHWNDDAFTSIDHLCFDQRGTIRIQCELQHPGVLISVRRVLVILAAISEAFSPAIAS